MQACPEEQACLEPLPTGTQLHFIYSQVPLHTEELYLFYSTSEDFLGLENGKWEVT